MKSAQAHFHPRDRGEFQIIDPVTRELRSYIKQFLADGKMLLKEHDKPEMHMLEFIAPEMDELGRRGELAQIEKIIREGTGADRQLAVWEQTHYLKAVVDHIVPVLANSA